MYAPTASTLPPGAQLVRDFVTPAEERRLLLRIGDATWLSDLNRRVQHYGFRYDYREPRGSPAGDPVSPMGRAHGPAPRAVLRRRDARAVHRERVPPGPRDRHARRSPRLRPTSSRRCRSPTTGRCGSGRATRVRTCATAAPGDRVVTLPRRSVLVLRDAARDRWMHGIDPSDTAQRRVTRISATFRTLVG